MIIIKTSVPGAHIILQINRYLYSVIMHKFFLANKTLKTLFFFFLGEAWGLQYVSALWFLGAS